MVYNLTAGSLTAISGFNNTHNNIEHAYAGQLNRYTNPIAQLVLQDRGIMVDNLTVVSMTAVFRVITDSLHRVLQVGDEYRLMIERHN
jgi:hypothetical protein